MLQKIGAICSIVSFILIVCSILLNGPEWQLYLLLIIILFCIIIVIYKRKNKPEKQKHSEEEKDKSSSDKNIRAFHEVINKIDVLLGKKKTDKALFEEVKTTAKSLIIDNFGKASRFYQDFSRIRFRLFIYDPGKRKKAEREVYEEGLGKIKGIMRSCINYLEKQK